MSKAEPLIVLTSASDAEKDPLAHIINLLDHAQYNTSQTFDQVVAHYQIIEAKEILEKFRDTTVARLASLEIEAVEMRKTIAVLINMRKEIEQANNAIATVTLFNSNDAHYPEAIA